MSALGDILSAQGDTAKQFFMWGVLYAIVNEAAQPYMRDLLYLVNEHDPNMVASPAELADMVVRNIKEKGPAAAEAKKSGIDEAHFTEMVAGAGEPPALQQVLEWWRRGYLEWGEAGPDKATVANAIATSRIYTYWSDVIKKAQLAPPSPADAINALVRNQITKEQAIAMAYFGGLGLSSLTVPAGADTSDTERAVQILVDTVGRPPSPTELADFVRRGLIPLGNLEPSTLTPHPDELSFAQGILEGDTKDKWLPLYAHLVEYVPPPRSIMTIYKDGGYTQEQAMALLLKNGMPQADAAAYLAAASGEKQAGTVQIALSTIQTLYYDSAIDGPTATNLLGLIGYSAQEAAFELAVQDLKREQAALSSAVSRIGNLYINNKIDITEARNALGQLAIPGPQQDQLVQTWTVEQASNLKILTEAQIVDAWDINALTDDEAINGLIAIGYTPFDAWVLLSVKHKSPLPGKPPAGPAPFYRPPSA